MLDRLLKRSLVTKAAKLRLLLNKQHPFKKTQTAEQKPSIAFNDKSKKRIEWYSDPYLLSRRINVLITKQKNGIPLAFELINRHPGACNKEVYGSMVSALAKEKKYTEMLKLYDIIIRRNRFLSPQGYTTIFHAMAHYAAVGDWNHKSNCMRATDKIWNHAIDAESTDKTEEDQGEKTVEPKISTQSINALLHLCDICCHAGGYNLGWEVFEQMGNVSLYPHQYSDIAKCLADHITYSMMMGICISADNPNAFKLGIQLWKNYTELLVQKPGKSFSTVENELVCKALKLYSSLSDFNRGFEEVKLFFGLSKHGHSKLKRKVYLSDMTTILRLCLESEKPALGLKWLELVEKEQSTFFTYSKNSDFYRHYLKSEIATQTFETGYNRLLKDDTCPIIYRLWISYEALNACKGHDLTGNIWWERVKQLQLHQDFGNELGHIYFYMKCGILMKDTSSVKSLLESKRAILERHITKRVTKPDGMVDYDDFRETVKRVMRWRFDVSPIFR